MTALTETAALPSNDEEAVVSYSLESEALDDIEDDVTSPGTRIIGARIVVVEDDSDLRDLVTARLTAEGYLVEDALSGLDLFRVLESVESNRWPLDGIDLILLDHRMPGMTGLEAIRRLRALHLEVPAILMTAFPEASVAREAATLGVPVISKPFSLNVLTLAIQASLLASPREPADHDHRRVPS